MIRILTDSASDLTATDSARPGVYTVPLSVTFADGTGGLDGVELTADEFYAHLKVDKVPPRTSQPSPQSFMTIFEDAKENGDQVIAILISSNLSGTYQQYKLNQAAIALVEQFRRPLRKALRQSRRFEEPSYIQKTAEEASEIASIGNQCGEGWLLTGEMIELIKDGASNIACLQPFACLPNHVTGKGMMKAIRERYPKANIVAIDYDPGASNVNQLNRIKLMMATAHKNLKEAEETEEAPEVTA